MDARPAEHGLFPRLADTIWRAPLVPVAIFLTLGILIDRYRPVPLHFSLAAALACLIAWTLNRRGPSHGLSLIYLWTACAAFGAAYHHFVRDEVPDNDIRNLAAAEAKPARLRGVVASEPNYVRGSGDDPLRSFPSAAGTRFVLRVNRLRTAVDWLDVSGLAQVTVREAKIHPVHVGDHVEILGRLALPPPPGNPGEFDYAGFLRDQGIGVTVSVPPTSEAIVLLAEGWPSTPSGWLAMARSWCQDVIAGQIPEKVAGVAGALLVGEGTGMTGDDWDKYVRTGVIHVLAISGQHLVVLGSFVAALVPLCGVSRRRSMMAVAVFLFLYALLTGGRPPVMRAAWAVLACSFGIWLQRLVFPANTFALGWIGVILVSPTDIFNIGCQLSFLAVAVLFWGTRSRALSKAFLVSTAFLVWVPFYWQKQGYPSALQALIDESRPLPVQYLIRFKRWAVEFYLLNATVWLALTPLIAGTQHVMTPVALAIGPPLVLLTSIALITGFLMLLSAPLGLAGLFGYPVFWSLAGCEALVDWGLSLPGAYFYVPDLPAWWLWIFYLSLFAFLTVTWVKERPLIFGVFAPAWALVGLVVVLGFFRTREFRCTFLAVGHGGCTVLETTDGRVLLYDAGTIGGPDLTRRQIAPYLWYRGIRRIDELLISHADLDHFNGAVALLERFSVGRVSLTPSFSDRMTSAVQLTMADFRRRGIPTRIVKVGDFLDEEQLHGEVLHPPPVGPEGNENARSLVLRLEQDELSILLTGDLQGPGLAQVLASPPLRIDILQAPHHGSKTSNNSELAAWAKPKVAISSQGPPRGNPKTADPYEPAGATYLTTWKEGAVTVRQVQGKWVVETYRTKKAIAVR
jgi:competence protein ComEC